MEHRGWSIEHPYAGEWFAFGPDYEAEWSPDGGWVGNSQRVSANTRDELIAEIDAWFEEQKL